VAGGDGFVREIVVHQIHSTYRKLGYRKPRTGPAQDFRSWEAGATTRKFDCRRAVPGRTHFRDRRADYADIIP